MVKKVPEIEDRLGDIPNGLRERRPAAYRRLEDDAEQVTLLGGGDGRRKATRPKLWMNSVAPAVWAAADAPAAGTTIWLPADWGAARAAVTSVCAVWKYNWTFRSATLSGA